MWKAKLNRHFTKIWPALKISAFLVLWNALFHSFTLSILLYWSLTSTRVSALNRMSTLNQFLSENQILFAALSSVSALLFFRDQVTEIWFDRRTHFPQFLRAWMRGLGFGLVMIVALIFSHVYEFLGFSTQLNLNFLASYAWILRSLLIFIFVVSTEFLTQVVIRQQLPDETNRDMIQNITLLLFYWIWFNPSLSELMTLLFLFSIFSSFWSSTGFISAFFILEHAVFGLNFFENEFAGILQLKVMKSDESFFQNHTLQAMLLILLILVQYAKIRLRKETKQT